MDTRWLCGLMAVLSVGAAGAADVAGAAHVAGAADVASPPSGGPELIARTALFGNPVRAQARLSPDGRWISFLAPRDGVLNVFVAPYGHLDDAKPVTSDRKRGIRQHFWAADGRHVLYLQDKDGDENWHVHAVDAGGGADRDLTPIAGVQAQVVGVSHERPGVVLVGLNDRAPEWHDLYEIDVASGERKLVEKNEQQFAGYLEDLQLRPQLALKTLPDGGGEIFRRSGAGWESVLRYAQPDSLTTQPVGIEGDGRTALLVSSIGRDKAALVQLDIASGQQRVLGESARADVSGVWIEPRTRMPQAYATEYLTTEYHALTKAAGADIAALKKALGPEFQVVSRTLDDDRWIVVVDDPQRAQTTYAYDRKTHRTTKLFDQRPQLAGMPTQPKWPVEIRARDGLTLTAYLTLPPRTDSDRNGRPDRPLPLVLNVHGGPWARDSYGFHPEHQWLSNRGYAVLSVNYRGSTGFGKAFINAANLEWGRRMHDDLLDAVKWAVLQKIAMPDRVAIYGGSYGGYATLVGITMTPDAFACGVDIVGPSNLATLIGSIPPYWKAFYEEFATRVGDPRTEQGRALLAERSPLTHVESIRRPLLIAQGANDPRVKQAESDRVVAAMKAKSLPVTYVLYPDEGHGFARPQNRLSFYAVAEGFLAQCLGGRAQPIGEDFAGSSVKVLEGASHVPGLAVAVEKMQPSPAARDQTATGG